MALTEEAEAYFRTMNPLATKIYEDIEETRDAYENIWGTLTEKQKAEIINESIIKPEITLKYSVLDNLDYDLKNAPIRSDNLLSFFAKDYRHRPIQDDSTSWRDKHSEAFIYQTQSQLDLCALVDREQEEPAPMSDLVISHSKVLNELKNALKKPDLKPVRENEPSNGIISKIIGNFKSIDDDKELLVSSPKKNLVASSDNFFRTNFKSPQHDAKYSKEFRAVVQSNSDVSEENRGLLSSSSQASSGDFQSCEDEDSRQSPEIKKTGFDFLDNW